MTEPTPNPDEVSAATHAADAAARHRADRPPTPREEAAAERNTLDPSVAGPYEHAIETGANIKGEGAIE